MGMIQLTATTGELLASMNIKTCFKTKIMSANGTIVGRAEVLYEFCMSYSLLFTCFLLLSIMPNPYVLDSTGLPQAMSFMIEMIYHNI